MLGRFLEISLASEDPLNALGFFKELGFRELSVGDVWSHPYAVVSDGQLHIGLHDYRFDSPALTFVQPNLDHWAEAYRVQDIELAFAKLSADEFNELGFVDPGGQMVTVLESRTFSPPPFDDVAFSRLGHLQAIAPPCTDDNESREFWIRLGLSAETGSLRGSGVDLTIQATKKLTCHYRGDVLEFAENAARLGLTNVAVSADETLATLKTSFGLNFKIGENVLAH